MDTYSLLRGFADSWMLIVMTLFFVGVVFWAWRPRSRKDHDEAASAIFRHETKPADDDPVSSSEEARK
ncbi:CcoQ/FixQ family Cbb3-type cytochrome c oxidase assembly chaperone [Rhodobacter sphaeroides]|mgnify:CR=1 FL=1|jgi:cytochrome c oxidase cbb3-type subunit 4|uniref:Cbb3-type cytochrome c oxidase CcoQ subunit n=2 Tax=Cereibacter sphaeroides TaxID=1063 RepID=Q3J014_CERS4|nr:CcoQ/FixQ family Cbb3-type cytochrome c oxidase assembly chaperone [Cereibacter sphaeroides]ABN77451.1 Cbb3-type cytochrome oxidase component [Cereibacter sphaeroides ATCC 17029]EKX59450.1 Cytochrome c oxidase subunit CcoQ [Rhodobacter sp. AKP1]AAB02558.1 cbb3-type cytochrome c oxidase CcoQ subunit [Cereibacter sphaeroides]ABA79870.1 Cbb3-type cytochrome c oxidase CcoQ subunit [Cereibacter sphaeroides 2.4.1]ACM01912.1 Cbb3-type cytochrome oxidase component [Cereibacter sphaeroides KD131]